MSKAVVGLLEEAVGSRGPAGTARLYHDLDSLDGGGSGSV